MTQSSEKNEPCRIKRIRTWGEFQEVWSESPYYEQRLGLLKAWPRGGNAALTDYAKLIGKDGERYEFYLSTAVGLIDAEYFDRDWHMNVEAQVCIEAIKHMLMLAEFQRDSSITDVQLDSLVRLLANPHCGYTFSCVEPLSRRAKKFLSDYVYCFKSRWKRDNTQVLLPEFHTAALVTRNCDLLPWREFPDIVARAVRGVLEASFSEIQRPVPIGELSAVVSAANRPMLNVLYECRSIDSTL